MTALSEKMAAAIAANRDEPGILAVVLGNACAEVAEAHYADLIAVCRLAAISTHSAAPNTSAALRAALGALEQP